MKIYYEKYGCTLNQAETEHVVQNYLDSGGVLVNSPGEADLIILGTCVVIKHTENHMVSRIMELSKLNKRMIIYGCLPAARGEILCKMKHVNSILPKEFTLNISNPLFVNHVSIPIAQGCTGHCTYCISKLARGTLKSYREEIIVEKVKEAVKRGIKEIRLTALDAAAYGKDIKTNLQSLLERINNLEGDFRIRVGMMEPSNVLDILDDLLESFKSEKIFKFFHIPVQSGDDSVLRLMGRDYSVDDFIHIVDTIRKNFQHYTLSTDIIVGFPGENEYTFRKTYELARATMPDIMNITRYSPREGTVAFAWKPVKSYISKDWSKKLTDLHREISEKRNAELRGKKFIALVTEKGKQGYMARTDGYRPVIIEDAELNTFYTIEIISTTPYYLIGNVVSPIKKDLRF